MTTPAYARPPDAVVDDLDSDPAGLTADEADRRLADHGSNEISGVEGRSAIDIFVEQFDSLLIWVLVAAALLSLWVGHEVDAILIGAIVVANGVFGFVQDYRAERSLEALRELAAPAAVVVREGGEREVPATDLVPGDVLRLSDGDVVPADARLLEATQLLLDEAPLTGESEPVGKSPEPVDAETPLADRTSMVYKGTSVTRGRATAVVTETGMETAVGDIAGSLAAAETGATPLQRSLDELGRRLGLGVLALSALVAPLLLWRGTGAVQAALTAVSLAVAAVPEGLPAVVTLTLALGVRSMADEQALVRRLPAVEALGSVDVICTDKTGTLTEGRMTATRAWVGGETVSLPTEGETDSLADRPLLLERALTIGALCNDATPEEGDPTERALVGAAERMGLDWERRRADRPRTDEVPFDSDRKWMGTVHDDVGYVKGAPEVVLDNADRLATPDGPVPLDDDRRDEVSAALERFADDALRVLAVAETDAPASLDEDLVFVGLVGLIDPPRAAVADAIAASERAGIDVKMVTGDNVRTGAAIARELGLGERVCSGSDVEAMDDATLRERVEEFDVFARTSPTHKVRILEALQDRGHVVAMTGDGVNDAPALKNADVGVAMGIRGTDVAQQASDMVLLDDNYATIERAIERGRGIFENVWKFVAYLLSANVAEVLLVFLASLAGYLILPAVQLLWINLLTDGLPALGLGADPRSETVMDRPPRDPDAGVIDRSMLGLIGGLGAITTVVMLALMLWALDGAPSVTPYAMTMVFTGFVVLEFGKLYVVRWMRHTPTFSNPWLGGAVLASLGLQLAVLYTPLSRYFGTVALAPGDWAVLVGVAIAVVPAYLVVAALARRL